MKKLLILLLEDDILGGVLSWPIRELKARVAFYKDASAVRRLVQAHEPDVVLLDEPCPPILDPELRAWLKETCRSVRVVWDASDVAWHPYLEEYANGDSFDLVVAADGAVEWPRRDCDVSLPTPVDPQWYERPAEQRTTLLGFSGSCGTLGPRKDVLGNLEADGTLTVRQRGPLLLPYKHNAEFYKTCHAVLNVAHTTSGRLQCKARAIEACLAGCLLFETRGSPLSRWLEPGKDYLEYSDADEVRTYCKGFSPGLMALVGERARKRVLELDLPRRFWSKVVGDE